MMKVLAAIVIVLTPGLLTGEVLAQGPPANFCELPEAVGSPLCPDVDEGTDADNPVIRILRIVINVLTALAVVIATITIVISAIQFTTAGGDAGKVSRARNSLIYSAVALVVITVARQLIIFVLNQV